MSAHTRCALHTTSAVPPATTSATNPEACAKAGHFRTASVVLNTSTWQWLADGEDSGRGARQRAWSGANKYTRFRPAVTQRRFLYESKCRPVRLVAGLYHTFACQSSLATTPGGLRRPRNQDRSQTCMSAPGSAIRGERTHAEMWQASSGSSARAPFLAGITVAWHR